jgi:hypothetical protein
VRQSLWEKAEPRAYKFTVLPGVLVQSFLIAFAARLSGLRAVAERCHELLGTKAFNTVSDALRRASSLTFVQAMVAELETLHNPGREELLALDSMALTLPKTQRHQCKKYNNRTVGGGVVWAYMIEAARNTCPIKVLKVVEGAWCDSRVMRDVSLRPAGPVYLMDRGFYAFKLLQKWLDEEVRFIVRARQRSLVYETIKMLSAPRRVGAMRLTLDAIVRLGAERADAHPVVRLIRVCLASGEELILATDRLTWSAERVLASYKKRWHIERFHRFLKDAMGLSHLYSFDQEGIAFLLYTALLGAILLFFADENPSGETILILRRLLKALRAALGLGTPWRRNSCAAGHAKRRTCKNGRKTAER